MVSKTVGMRFRRLWATLLRARTHALSGACKPSAASTFTAFGPRHAWRSTASRAFVSTQPIPRGTLRAPVILESGPALSVPAPSYLEAGAAIGVRQPFALETGAAIGVRATFSLETWTTLSIRPALPLKA